MRGARPRRAARGGRMAGRACSNWRETGTKRRSVDALRQLTRVCCVPIHHRTPTAVSIASSASIYGHSVVHTAFPGTSRSPLSPYIPWALECVSPRSPPLDLLEVCMISHLQAGGGLNTAQAGIPTPVWSRKCCLTPFIRKISTFVIFAGEDQDLILKMSADQSPAGL